MRRLSLSALSYGAVALFLLAAIGFLIAALYEYLYRLTDPVATALLVAAALGIVALLILIVLWVVRLASTGKRDRQDEPIGEKELLALASHMGKELAGKVSPLTAAGLAAAAGFFYGIRK